MNNGIGFLNGSVILWVHVQYNNFKQKCNKKVIVQALYKIPISDYVPEIIF